MTVLGNPYSQRAPQRFLRAESGTVILRLDRNESAYPPAAAAIDAAMRELRSASNRYGDPKCDELRSALSDYTGATSDAILAGNGSDEIIEMLARVMLGPGVEALVHVPTFIYYTIACAAVGAHVVAVPRRSDFRMDTRRLIDSVTPRTRMILLANPNNPTGVLDSREDIQILLAELPDVLIVVDECYYEYCGQTVADLVGRSGNLVVLRSFSKSFALAGLRVGYAIARPALCDLMRRNSQAHSANRVAQAAAVAALGDLADLRRRLMLVAAERVRLESALRDLGLQVVPSTTNFVLVNTEPFGFSASELTAALYSRGIAIADMSRTEGLGRFFVRISVGLEHESNRLVEELARLHASRWQGESVGSDESGSEE